MKQTPIASAALVRRLLIGVLGLLTILTAYTFWKPKTPAYQVRVFQTSGGWGYDIVNHQQTIIHQPILPGIADTAGFATPQQARRVGEYAAGKLKQSGQLPTLTPDELRRLGIAVPEKK